MVLKRSSLLRAEIPLRRQSNSSGQINTFVLCVKQWASFVVRISIHWIGREKDGLIINEFGLLNGAIGVDLLIDCNLCRLAILQSLAALGSTSTARLKEVRGIQYGQKA